MALADVGFLAPWRTRQRLLRSGFTTSRKVAPCRPTSALDQRGKLCDVRNWLLSIEIQPPSAPRAGRKPCGQTKSRPKAGKTGSECCGSESLATLPPFSWRLFDTMWQEHRFADSLLCLARREFRLPNMAEPASKPGRWQTFQRAVATAAVESRLLLVPIKPDALSSGRPDPFPLGHALREPFVVIAPRPGDGIDPVAARLSPLKPKFNRQPGRSGMPDRSFRMPRSFSPSLRRR